MTFNSQNSYLVKKLIKNTKHIRNVYEKRIKNVCTKKKIEKCVPRFPVFFVLLLFYS